MVIDLAELRYPLADRRLRLLQRLTDDIDQRGAGDFQRLREDCGKCLWIVCRPAGNTIGLGDSSWSVALESTEK